MVTLAREGRGLTQSKLARLIGVSQGHLSKIEAGLIPATDQIAERLAVALDYPVEFFALIEPIFGPGTSEFFHRKRQALSNRVLDQMHATINIRRIHVSRLLRAVELDPDSIPELDPDAFGENAVEVARAVRAAWNMPKGPVPNVTQALEDAGGIVMLSDFGTPLLDAVSRWVPGLPPLFFVNQDAPGDRARLTLAHELGHMVMHRVARPDMEQQAFEFASEFLMPERDIRTQFDGLTLDRLISLKLHWKVSMQALLRRAEHLGRIDPGKARYLWSQIARAGYRTREPVEADVPREEPQQLNEILRIYRDLLTYSPDELATLLALTPHELAGLYGVESGSTRARLRLVGSSMEASGHRG
jgi:Zn-dependent peptidase ImmA (M78 family)/transcriptional regulator with XRE-family HTH domain